MDGLRLRLGIAIAAMCILFPFSGSTRPAAQLSDAFSGSWALNVAKSSFKPGPPLKSGILTVEYANKARKSTFDNVTAGGDRVRSEYTAPEDGQDYPLRGSPNADTVSLRRTNSQTLERVDKRRGQVVMTYSIRASVDGKTLTVVQKGVTIAGDMITNTLVFDRK